MGSEQAGRTNSERHGWARRAGSMTEGQDAGAAPVPRNAGYWPGMAAAGSSFPGGAPLAAAPVSAGHDIAGSPMAWPAAASAEQGGTGWPGNERAGSVAAPGPSGAPGWPPPSPDEQRALAAPAVPASGSMWTRPVDQGRAVADPDA